MVQKMIIDALHKEGKSQKVITERGGSSQSAVSKPIKCKVDWKEEIWVGKCAQATGMTASLRTLSSKADSNTWESFTRSELKLESVHQESTRSDIFRKRDAKPLQQQKHRQKHLTSAKQKNNWTVAQWSKVLFSDESTFCFSFGNQGPRVWRKTESKLLEVQCEVSEVRDDLGCRDVCWRWSSVFYQVQSQFSRLPGDFGALCLHLLTSFMEMLIFFSSRTLAPAHTAQSTSKWFADHDVTVLDWPDNMPDLKPIWDLWDIFKRKMRNSGSNNTDELKAVSQADRFHTTPHWCWSLC